MQPGMAVAATSPEDENEKRYKTVLRHTHMGIMRHLSEEAESER